jgi:hypothetical protein
MHDQPYATWKTKDAEVIRSIVAKHFNRLGMDESTIPKMQPGVLPMTAWLWRVSDKLNPHSTNLQHMNHLAKMGIFNFDIDRFRREQLAPKAKKTTKITDVLIDLQHQYSAYIKGIDDDLTDILRI